MIINECSSLVLSCFFIIDNKRLSSARNGADPAERKGKGEISMNQSMKFGIDGWMNRLVHGKRD